MMRRTMIVLLAALVSMALASAASALTIENVSMGTIEFDSGGFESYLPGGDPVPAVVGNWSIKKKSGLINANVEVAGPGSGGPGANEGDNYLKMLIDTPGAGGGNGGRGGALAVMANTALTGDQLVAELGLYVDSSVGMPPDSWNYFPVLTFGKDTTGYWNARHSWLGCMYPNEFWLPKFSSEGREEGQLFLGYYDNAWKQVTTDGGATNMFLDMDSWHDVQVDLTVGVSSTLTLDGVTSDAMAVVVGMENDPVNGFHVYGNGSSSTMTALYYIDNISGGEGAIPEPGTLVLLIGGLAGLLLWRRR